jgi:serine/threonine protein kinase
LDPLKKYAWQERGSSSTAHNQNISSHDASMYMKPSRSSVGSLPSSLQSSGPSAVAASLGPATPSGASALPRRSAARPQPLFVGGEIGYVGGHGDVNLVGTPEYLAPEIWQGHSHGQEVDWWSVGVILYEMLVGVTPFAAESLSVLFDNCVFRKLEWGSDAEHVPAAARDLIERLLEKRPEARLGSRGANEIKNHEYFKDVNWETLLQTQPRFVPRLDSSIDTSYFAGQQERHPSFFAGDAAAIGDSSDEGTRSTPSPVSLANNRASDGIFGDGVERHSAERELLKGFSFTKESFNESGGCCRASSLHIF